MSEPYIGEIKIFAGNFAPRGWAFCDGQLLPIAENTALFSLYGTTYGGDGRFTFALPNLQGRAAMHPGSGPGLTTRRLGQQLGTNSVTLTESQIPSHTHTMRANTATNTPTPQGHILGGGDPAVIFHTAENLVDMHTGSLSTAGSSQAHDNMQPYLGMHFICALTGTYPSRS